MDEDRILYKCIINTSVDNYIKQNKVMYSKRYLLYQIILSFILIIAFLSFTFSEMSSYHVSFKFSAFEYFENIARLFINVVMIVVIFKIAYVCSWIRLMFESILMRKNFCFVYSYVCFYDSECILFSEVDSELCSKLHVSYSSIDKYVAINDSILLDSKKIRFSVFKDSFEIGSFDDFVKFIQVKTKNEF